MNRSPSASLTLRSDTLVTPYEVVSPGWVTVQGSAISAVGTGVAPAEGRVVDLGARLLVPGFIDLHVHGGAGAQVNDDEAAPVTDAVRRMAGHHARHGTTALLATTISDSFDHLREVIRGVGGCVGVADPSGAQVLGVHLEGPWLAPERAGAHEVRHLRPPTLDELRGLTGSAAGVVRMITLAPELDGALAVVEAMAAEGVVAAIGHTDADLTMTVAAIGAGARHVTHLFNAMPALHHRRPGPVGAALSDERVTVEVIADGVHLDPRVLGLVIRLTQGRLVAVTDASAASGLATGRTRLGSRDVDVSGDRVTLVEASDTLAGSGLTMDRAVANLVAAGASLPVAVTAASATPARVIGERDRGVIRVGAAADLVVLEPSLTCAATIVGGRVVYDSTGLLA